MTRLPVLLAAFLAAAPAAAQDQAFWGGTGCQIVPVTGQAHVAEVRCRNRITAYFGVQVGRIEAGGVGVGIAVQNTSEPAFGQEPDIFSFEADPGFFVEPSVMAVDEHGDGVALIFEWAGM